MQFEQKLIAIFWDKEVDTNIRGMIVEMLITKSLDNSKNRISVQTLEAMIKCLTSDPSSSGKEFLGFMMSRLYELASEDEYLKKVLR